MGLDTNSEHPQISTFPFIFPVSDFSDTVALTSDMSAKQRYDVFRSYQPQSEAGKDSAFSCLSGSMELTGRDSEGVEASLSSSPVAHTETVPALEEYTG